MTTKHAFISNLFAGQATDKLKSSINDGIMGEFNKDKRNFGKNVVNAATTGGGVQMPGPAGEIGKVIGDSVAKEIPNSPNLSSLSKGLMAGGQGDYMGAAGHLGQHVYDWASSKFAQDMASPPPEVTQGLKEKLPGSPAAKGGADIMAGAVNNISSNLVMNSTIGKGIQSLNPAKYMSSLYDEYFGPGGTSTSGAAGGTSN